MPIVHVQLGERAYDIEIGSGNLPTAGRFISACTKCSHAVLITDGNVLPHAQRVAESLRSESIRTDLFSVPAGEATKCASVAERLWNDLLRCGTDRKSVVVAVGGGVIGDLAGFVAATFARGLKFVQIPTTLLAHVDSSVGGKVGINLPDAKNMVGSFWQPRGVLIDIELLDTLPVREFRAGLAEVVKYGVILDAEFFAYLEQHVSSLGFQSMPGVFPDAEPQPRSDRSVLEHVISRCCRLKADVVEQDEREETGLRAVLNYGHTFCHAIEAVTEYGQFLHGEAVSIGMLCASRLAELLGRVDREFTQRQERLLSALGCPTAMPPLDRNELLAAMQRDKKVEHGKLRFVLPTRMGHVELVGGIEPALVRAAMDG